MKTLIVLAIISYLYGAKTFYRTVVKEAEWNILEVEQTPIEYLFSGLFFIGTILGALVGVCIVVGLIVETMIKYLP